MSLKRNRFQTKPIVRSFMAETRMQFQQIRVQSHRNHASVNYFNAEVTQRIKY